MKYVVEIDPTKEQEFLQLLHAWQGLGVVQSFKVGTTGEETEEAHLKSWKKRSEKTPQELAEDYRDLVD
jgi:hypothetical protein